MSAGPNDLTLNDIKNMPMRDIHTANYYFSIIYGLSYLVAA
jgi:hypothetical protein